MKLYQFLIILIFIISCSSPEDNEQSGDSNNTGNTGGTNNNNTFSNWLIPKEDIYDGAGKDGIPSIDNPVFLSGDDSYIDTYMNPEDLVIGIKIGSEIKAYPHRILDWHEVVNDEINGQEITINYCPLTRTGFVWKYTFESSNVTFGVSGLLYNSNLILYDRKTNSNWSQMKLQCVNGSEQSETPSLIQVVEINWKDWKNMYPETKVLGNKQGFDRNYSIYPYDGYLGSDDFLYFPVAPEDNRLLKKERVHGIISDDKAKAYRFESFSGGKVIKDEYLGTSILLVGNKNVIKSFVLPENMKDNTFTYSYNNSQEFFSDNLGNKWSIFGEVIEGPLQSQRMASMKSVTGFWFSLASFYPNPEIY